MASRTSGTRPSPRRVVYTALIGEYESLNDQPIASDTDVDFVCFTDSETLRSDVWQIRLVEPRFPLDTVRSARYLKVRGTELLPEYDESLWIDNTVLLTADPALILDSWLAEHDLAMPLHSLRRTVIAEFDAVATHGYDDSARVYEQLIHYAQLDEPTLHVTPYWTALVARRHTPEVVDAMRLWYDHILRYSRRDQLSVNVTLAAAGIAVNALTLDNAESDVHRWPVHSARRWEITRGRLDEALRIPLAEVGKLDNRIRELQERIDSERERSDRIEHNYSSSWSWRLTRPLRRVARMLGR